jgi:uncharacterized protein YcaQ
MVLEALFRKGNLAVSRTSNFARVYELPESAFPSVVLTTPAKDHHDAQRELLGIAAMAHGIGTARDLADYYRSGSRRAAAPCRTRRSRMTRRHRGRLDRAAMSLHGRPAAHRSGPRRC